MKRYFSDAFKSFFLDVRNAKDIIEQGSNFSFSLLS
jgi:hypothetical protein